MYIINLNKIIHVFLYIVLSTVTLLSIGSLLPRQWGNLPQENCNCQICVSNTGISSHIMVPIKNDFLDWRNYLPLSEIINNNAIHYYYLSFGWGDRSFYINTPTWADLELSTAFQALFIPTPSVMNVQLYQKIPQNVKTKCVEVSDNHYLELMKYINASFQLDKQGRKIKVAEGHHSGASFYAAKGSYSIFRNSNNWTAEGLRIANVNTPLWAGLSSAIMLHLRSSCESSVAKKLFVIQEMRP